jgi:uncharacterized DUF497 family protein
MHVSGFDWDNGNWPKCASHGVSQAEIEAMFHGTPMVLPDRTGVGGETRLNAIGLNEAGRHLFVVFTIRHTGGVALIRPISARYMHQKEIDHYERRTRPQADPGVPNR